jgi:hypothetical protein
LKIAPRNFQTGSKDNYRTAHRHTEIKGLQGLEETDSILNRIGLGNALAPSVVHVDELFRFVDEPDDVESADGLFFRHVQGGFGRPKGFAFGDIFCPLVVAGEIFQAFRVFNKDVHKPTRYHIHLNSLHTIGNYIRSVCVSKMGNEEKGKPEE